MRYLGNKTRLLKEISKFIEKQDIKGKVFCDIFAGTGSVGDFFKNKYDIISNDFLYSSSVINKGRILNKTIPEFERFQKKYKLTPFEYLNQQNYEYNNQYFIANNYSPKGDRQFFTTENSIKIDGMRLEIEEIYKNGLIDENEYYYLLGSLIESVMGISNITGTYEAFLKNWDKRSFKSFKIVPLEIYPTEKSISRNVVYCEDANDLIREISGDILYIDTPYTITEYSSAYHLLETIAKYDYPEIRGKTGRRVNNDKKSLYSKRKSALYAFEDLIRQARFNDIIISYSNQSLVSLDDLVNMLKKFSSDGKVIVKKIPYREYKNLNSSQKAPNLFEVLIYLKKDLKYLKSPLNYSGSKDNLISSMVKYLPCHINTFVDVMGGAFNVGANIVAMDKVIYNEYNPFVYNIIKMILETKNRNLLIKEIERIINEHNLSKEDKEKYLKFREFYNCNPKTIYLFILQMFCFQNQMRFNSSLKFNTPIGNCAYNETTKDRIIEFVAKTEKVEFTNYDFKNIDWTIYDKDTLFYFDPPYFITNATYNDGRRGFNGWNAELETELLETLTKLHGMGYKFMLSNVIEHKRKKNNILKEWIDTHNFTVHKLEHPTRKEIIVVNY